MAKSTNKKVEAEERTLMLRTKDYFQSLKFEWQKVSFPSKKELSQSTIVVFLFTIIMMAVIAGYDAFIGWVFTKFVLSTG